MGNDVATSDTLTASDDTEPVNDVAAPDDAADVGHDDSSTPAGPSSRWSTRLRNPLTFGAIAVVILSALVGWLGFQADRERRTADENAQFLQVARQGALNLTTIDWQHADDDVKRIMDNATGEFYDEFQQRSAPFVEVVKQAQSVSVGTVTEAALETHSSTEAQALVAVSVKTSNTTGQEPIPRAWRMRISVQKVDDRMKISRVEFVP